MPAETTQRLEKLNRLGQQLSQTEHLLETHPLTQNTWGVARVTLHFLNLQTRWTSAGELTRLLIGLQTAFIGDLKSESVTGFMGPHLAKCHKAVVQLMTTVLPKDNVGSHDLLSTVTQLITLITAYVTTQTLGDWKGLFHKNDPAGAKKGGMLLQELGLMWLFGSRTIEKMFETLSKCLELDESAQKTLSDIGVFYMLTLILVMTEEKNQAREDLMESLQQYMMKPLDSVEKALEKAQSRNLVDDETATTASSQLQLIRRTLESQDIESLPQSIESCFQALNMSHEGIEEDLKQLTNFCKQVSYTFKNIFHQTEKTMTSMDQAA